MYIEIFKQNQAYRGVIAHRDEDTITLNDILDGSEHIVDLTGEYTLIEYGDNPNNKSHLDNILYYLKLVKNDDFLSEVDKKVILNSNNIIAEYQIIKTLRALKFNFNSLSNLTSSNVKKSLKVLLEEEYDYNIQYISEDEDLTQEEKQKLILTMSRSKENYLDLLKNQTDIIVMLGEFPPMFNEKLLYLGDIVNTIKNEREFAELLSSSEN